MRKRKFLILGVLALSALAAAGAHYVRSIDVDRHRPALAEALRAATGRDVAIDGPVSLSLLPWPRFHIEDVAIANAPWGTRGALVRIAQIDADIALLPLLKGERRISRVHLLQPDFWFETDAVGKVNWIMAMPPAPEADAGARGGDANALLLTALDVGQVEMTGGRITYRDGATGDITVLSVASATIEGDGHSQPLALRFAGEWDAIPIEVHGAIGPINATASDAGVASAVNLRLKFGGAEIAAKGTVGDARSGPGAALHVAAKVDDLDGLTRRFGIALPLSSPVALDADMRFRRARLEIADANLSIGQQTLTGAATVDLSGDRPAYTADFRAEALVLDAAASGTRAAVLADALIGSGALAHADGTVSVRADSLRTAGVTLRELEAAVRIAGGSVTIAPVRARTVAGLLEGEARLDTSVSPARLTASVKAPAFAAGPLLQHLGTIKAFGGVGSIAASVGTVVGTPDAMIASLEGDALLAMGEGRLTLEPYETPFGAHVSGAGSLAGLLAAEGRQDVGIECAAARIKVADGAARTEGFVFLSEDARVRGEGTLNLATGQVALTLLPEARNGPLLVGDPVTVKGSVPAPLIARDTTARPGLGEAALYPVRRFFRGLAAAPGANACLRALPPVPRKRQVRGRPIAQRPAPAAPESAPRPVPQSVSPGGVQAE